MTAVTLSLVQARQLQLAAQGLLRPPSHKARFDDLLSAVRRMSLLQIDTIHVVARSPYLVLFSRRWHSETCLNTGRMKPALFPLRIIPCCVTAC